MILEQLDLKLREGAGLDQTAVRALELQIPAASAVSAPAHRLDEVGFAARADVQVALVGARVIEADDLDGASARQHDPADRVLVHLWFSLMLNPFLTACYRRVAVNA